jgi:hypothetical protein
LPARLRPPNLVGVHGPDYTAAMRQCNAKAPPSKALVKGLARELDISEAYLDKLAQEVK